MAGLFDSYFDPSMFQPQVPIQMPNVPMNLPQGSFPGSTLPPNAIPAGPAMMTSQGQQPNSIAPINQQQQQPNFLNTLSNGLANHSNMLLALGAGLLSPGGYSAGLSGAMKGAQLDKASANSAALGMAIHQALIAKGANPAQAAMIAKVVSSGSPQGQALGIQLLSKMISPKKPVAVAPGASLVNPDTGNVVFGGGEAPTNDIKNYHLAQKQGYQGTFTQYQTEMKHAGASNTSVTVGGQKIPNVLLKDAISNSKQADSLNNQVQELTMFGEMLKNAPTGALTPATLPVQAALKQIGITVGKDVPLLQAIQAQENQLALRFRNPDSGFGLTGNTSNQDVRFLKSTVPGLEKTPEANRAIVTILIAKQRRIAQIASMKSDWIFQHGNLVGWNKARDEFIKNNSMFTPEEKLTLEGLKHQSNASLQNGWSVTSPQSNNGLPTGWSVQVR